MSSAAHFDPEAITRLKRFGGDALVFEMIDLFSAGAPARLATAREAVDAGDGERARGVLHSLKSSAGQLGAVALQAMCEDGEQHAARGDVAAVAALLPAMDAEWAAVHQQLNAIRTGGA
jgi:HPt (histidine-containing phosphotransfer) domain-containing protein